MSSVAAYKEYLGCFTSAKSVRKPSTTVTSTTSFPQLINGCTSLDFVEEIALDLQSVVQLEDAAKLRRFV